MTRNTRSSLGDHLDQSVATQIDSGTASDLIEAKLRPFETGENKLDVLRDAMLAGEQSGCAAYSYQSLVVELDATLK